jgi:magnesium transporter
MEKEGSIDLLILHRDTINNVQSGYMTKLSVDMLKHSNAMSRSMRAMSSVSTIFLPLSLIAGLWGMNVRVPGQHQLSYHWFGSIVGICAAVGISLFVFFVRRRWI